jgi:hypothetical protein
MSCHKTIKRLVTIYPLVLAPRRIAAGTTAGVVRRNRNRIWMSRPIWMRRRRAGAKGDGQFLLDSFGISPTNTPLGGALGNMGLASFLDEDPAMQYRYLPVFTLEYLEQAGYTSDQAQRIITYLHTRNPNTLAT